MKWKLLAVVGLSFTVSACFDLLPKCFAPGTIGPVECYHYLTIIDNKAPSSGELTTEIARAVIKEDSRGWLNFYEESEYPRIQYKIHVEGSVADLKEGQSYMFVSKVNDAVLRRCTSEECNKTAQHFSRSDTR